jgi:hypothetical protein
VTVVLTLALSIGATTAIFSLGDAVLLRPLPFPESDRLVAIDTLELPPGQHQLISLPQTISGPLIPTSLTGSNKTKVRCFRRPDDLWPPLSLQRLQR